MVINKYLAELLGTFVLVFVGSVSILAAGAAGVSPLLVAPFGFGLGIYAAIYMFGDVSGGHFNPAVTLGAFLDKRTDFTDLVGYWIGQVAGALLASLAVLWASDQMSVAGTYTTPTVSSWSAFLLEAILTMIFVMVILESTKKWPREAPIAIALTLVAIHFAAVPLTGASVNPARTLGPGIVGGSAPDLWVYLIAPLVGAVVAWLLHALFRSEVAVTS
jgi:aquaporin Z